MKSFSELIGSDIPVLVDFSAEWCGPCKTLKPILEEVKSRIGSKAIIIKVDVDKNAKVSEQYMIRSVPTMILFKQGNILWRDSGVMPADDLEKIILQYTS